MDQDAWITAHVNALNYFGGVPRMIQCDNLKTGVEKHGRHEIVLNRTYQELAEHYETAIVPARLTHSKTRWKTRNTGTWPSRTDLDFLWTQSGMPERTTACAN